MHKEELLNLYLTAEKKKTFRYILNFLTFVLDGKIHPILNEDWELLQSRKKEIIYYSKSKELLMQIQECESAACVEVPAPSKQIEVYIISSKDIDYKGRELLFNKDNFEQFEIRQFWFHAIPPQFVFQENKYFIPETQSLFYFLAAFRLDRYFQTLIQTSEREKEELKEVSYNFVNKLEQLLEYYHKKDIDWQDEDKHFQFIFTEEDKSWSGYFTGGQNISSRDNAARAATPNILIKDKKLLSYDQTIYQLMEQVNKHHHRVKNVALSMQKMQYRR